MFFFITQMCVANGKYLDPEIIFRKAVTSLGVSWGASHRFAFFRRAKKRWRQSKLFDRCIITRLQNNSQSEFFEGYDRFTGQQREIWKHLNPIRCLFFFHFEFFNCCFFLPPKCSIQHFFIFLFIFELALATEKAKRGGGQWSRWAREASGDSGRVTRSQQGAASSWAAEVWLLRLFLNCATISEALCSARPPSNLTHSIILGYLLSAAFISCAARFLRSGVKSSLFFSAHLFHGAGGFAFNAKSECFLFTPRRLIWPFSAPVVGCRGYKAP